MKIDSKKAILCIIGCILGVLIILTPIIITGRLYDESKILGGLLVSEFVMRTLSLIIGFGVIYDAIKVYFKES
ncbi:hypothetical protein [Clostridium faecium]|uniref:Uncharacterized protein n=1 Tax=Clostridium faecium TaxID=2762223 RepID=A0ABR8YQG6_9CLOT|nr:hypothetical protein [Clostridium faecium]MBD8046499.1 hypothetical protein [Clostridium faecium]